MDLSLMDQACFNSILILLKCALFTSPIPQLLSMSFICLNLFMQGIIIKKFCNVCFLRRNFVITLAQTVPRNTGLWKRVDTHGLQ